MPNDRRYEAEQQRHGPKGKQRLADGQENLRYSVCQPKPQCVNDDPETIIGESLGGQTLLPRASEMYGRSRSRDMGPSARFDDVLAAARHGSEWAWGEILADLGPPIEAYARSQGVEDPEDTLGQVLEGLVRGIHRFRGTESAFRSWAFTIAHSRIVDAHRRRARRPTIADREVPDVAGPMADASEASTALSRERALEMLDALPSKQRDVVALRVVAGLSVEETARVLKKRPGAVRVSMHRAMLALQHRIPSDA